MLARYDADSLLGLCPLDLDKLDSRVVDTHPLACAPELLKVQRKRAE